ncbi:MAG: flagellar biosynthesis protein FlhB [Candidatus Nitrohelix vancouverensis]|uniref:Flagellar biosynthetic protein FlhB n=1 Tax=Candidatus Nitrohelix vancouverensis TaxID=2705534 RepID=A0A7T0C2P1_9BACT|nr:MAG: flagellar biosynthesis protein FlhB [Candidatus Nitrohelix vancouverensis]
MAEDNKDQKTEEPSSKRITDAQEKGNFANSREITSTFILLGSITIFLFAGQELTLKMIFAWHEILSQAGSTQLSIEESYNIFKWTLDRMFQILAPILLSIMLAGIIANLFQTQGFKFSVKPLAPKWSKLNPLKGFGRMFSKNSAAELFKSIFKITVISLVAYFSIMGHLEDIPPMMGYSVGQILVFLGEVSIEIMIKVLLTLILLAALDFSFQKYTYIENLRMTKQEVKDERKEMDGNPQIKQRIRSAQYEMARKRMMAAVPHADVVITNPTHISVAIKYDAEGASAPIVVAKGQDEMAARIRELAKKSDVPLVEDKPLARVLYKTVEIGQIIPSSLYKAVAEILAYVYRLKNRV